MDPFRQVGQEFAIISHAAHQRTDLLEVLGHGHFHQSRNFFRIGAYTHERNGVASKIIVRGAGESLRGGELEVVLASAFEEGSCRLDVGRRMRVENDHIIEVGRHLCQTFDDFVNHFDEPAGRSTAALGHDEPLVEARRSAKRRERDAVLVRGNLEKRGDKIEERKHPSLPQGVEDLVHARNRQLAEVVDLVEFLL